jgi:hypothetical protein
MSPRGLFISSVPPRGQGLTMRLYQSVATAIGTHEALDLAHRLAAWHDAMVIHRRRPAVPAGLSCDVDCPHEQAESLWLEAVDVYGARAHEFAFLRAFGTASSRPANARLSEARL